MSGILVGASSGYAPAGGGGGGTYYSPVTIDPTKVPSTQTDFPVLINVTDARFKTVANSGHVSNANGYDIRPYSDSGLTTALTYEIERYNASTGEVVMWVKIASLSSTVDTVIYLGYGDSGLTTNGSSSSTWSNSYLGVYHLGNGTTLNVNSSTGSNNGTNHSATAAAGQIDGCGSFASASSHYIDLGTGMNPSTTSTLSAWAKATTLPGSYNAVVARDRSSPQSSNVIFVKSNGKAAAFWSNTGGLVGVDGLGATTLATGTWYYLVSTYTGAGTVGGVLYVNGVFQGQSNASLSLETTVTSTLIGCEPPGVTLPWNGQIDEVRFASVARSADWITTEYNNQSAPGTFMTLGTEV